VGAPDAARLHKAAKAAPRVAVYTNKDPAQLVNRLASERIHNVEAIELYGFDRGFVAGLSEFLDRRVAFALSVTERELYLSIRDRTLTSRLARYAIA
jgi:uncharacterized protein YaeQ